VVLERLEGQIRAAPHAKEHQEAALRYRAALKKAGDLEGSPTDLP
jgi:hypothetical protein